MLDLSTLTTAQQVSLLYIGYYDRAGEPDGATFWNSAIDAPDFTVSNAADQFATQPETLAAYPFLGSPTAEEAESFITDVYQNLFNRDPDGPDSLTQEQIDAGEVSGLEFWSDVLLGAIAGTNDFSVGQIILAIAGGAQGDDQVTLLNKVNVGVAWTDAAEGRGFGDTPFADLPANVQANAASIIAPVTDAQATVEAATAEIAEIFAPAPVEGNTMFLTSSTDVTGMPGLESTENDDTFLGYIAQNGFTGGVSNSLSSADRLDGKGGNDTLFAELSTEFVGATSGATTIDVQPKLTSIERVELEARDMGTSGSGGGSTTIDIDADDDIDGFLDFIFEEVLGPLSFSTTNDVFTPTASFDGKDSFGINEIGSVDSDGDLLIENLNTKVNEDDAVGRKTADMTILMDHTDNFNSDGDASDLTVYFDENYLLANDPVQAGALLTIELMDLDETTIGGNPLEDNPFGLITFNFGDELKTLDYGTDSNTYAELLADIQAAIDLAAQTDPDFSQLSASFGPIFTVRDTDDDPNPARPPLDGTTIVITNSGPEILEAVEMRATGSQPAGKDFHTGFDNEAPEEENFKIEVDIDLHKVGRGGEGGNLIVGGKDQEIGQGIHVFNVDVLGAGEGDSSVADKPSNMGTLTSTNGDLQIINIETAAEFVDGDSWASLTIRDGFNEVGSDEENDDLMMVNANDFLGDLTLGTGEAVINLDMLSALGGGDVTFVGVLDGEELNQDYVYLTGAGEDTVSVTIEGDALDYAESGLEIKTGSGDDAINVDFDIFDFDDNTIGNDGSNEQLNQAVLDNVDINGEGGDDVINVDGIGNANINGGAGDDIIYTDGDGFRESASEPSNAVWAFNFDNVRADAGTGSTTGPSTIGRFAPEDLPGVETELAYLDGATVTVTLSGAGIDSLAAGGGVMAIPAEGAVQGDDGYEASFTITDLIGPNEYYGDQRDVNAAVISAIENDPVLDALLSASVAANNTLVIVSKTSGNFAAEDIRIDIEHGQAENSSYANAVLNEARELFSDSSYTLTELWGTTTFTSPASYQTDDDDAPGVLFSDSEATNDWYDGLSVEGDTIETNSADDNLHTIGVPSASETDNVINGGLGNDIIVLSTDASAGGTVAFTPSGDNSMINGASNETIVMEGAFGDDTVMNFTTAIPTPAGDATELDVVISQIVADSNIDGSPEIPPQPEVFVLDVSAVPLSSTPYTVEFGSVTVNIPADATPAEIAEAIRDAFEGAGGDPSGFDTDAGEDVSDGRVTFTSIALEDVTPDVTIDGSFISTANFLNNAVIEEESYQQGTDETIDAVNEEFQIQFFDVPTNLGTDTDDAEISVTIELQAGDPLGAFGPLELDIDATAGQTAEELVDAILDEYGDGQPGDEAFFTVTEGDSPDQILVTLDGPAAGTDFDLFRETDPIITIDDSVVVEIPAEEGVTGGVDFLDFGAYLTSLTDISTNGAANPDSDVSNNLIDVVLDYNEDNTLGGLGDGAANAEVEANEVAVVRMADDDAEGETFDALSESDVEDLFNNDAATSNYADLSAAGFDVIDNQTDNAVVDGDGKAIFMVEDGDNLGHYKVFELSWDASEDDGDEGVVADLVGTLDFGTSLTDLADVNLVGSDDYDQLNELGILAFA